MKDKIDIKFTKNHYIYESDSLKEIFNMSIGDKVEFKGYIGIVTNIIDDEITILNTKTSVYEKVMIDDLRLINLHVIGKEYTIWKISEYYEKESKEIKFNSSEVADLYRILTTVKKTFKAVNYGEWFDKLEDFVNREELY